MAASAVVVVKIITELKTSAAVGVIVVVVLVGLCLLCDFTVVLFTKHFRIPICCFGESSNRLGVVSRVGRAARQTLVFWSCVSVTKSETCVIIRVAHAVEVAAQSEAAAASCGILVLLILQQPQSTVASHFLFFTACGNDSLETFRPSLSSGCVCARVRLPCMDVPSLSISATGSFECAPGSCVGLAAACG